MDKITIEINNFNFEEIELATYVLVKSDYFQITVLTVYPKKEICRKNDLM